MLKHKVRVIKVFIPTVIFRVEYSFNNGENWTRIGDFEFETQAKSIAYQYLQTKKEGNIVAEYE